jgi:hypothetical protein
LKPKKDLPKVSKRTNAAETKRAVNNKEKQSVFNEHKQRGTIQTAENALKRIFK